MIAAIMQPYFFPYIGYFQLMRQVDCFVFYDDVNYIKRGWVNRNRILLNGQAAWLTLPVARASQNRLISESHYLLDQASVASVLGKIRSAYLKAPYYQEVESLISPLFASAPTRVSEFNALHLQALARALGLPCEFRFSSRIEHDRSAGGQQRILEICQRLGAGRYVNPVGGQHLYDAGLFAAAGIELSFFEPQIRAYPQFDAPHVGQLSVIDALMFLGLEGTAELLEGGLLVQRPANRHACGP